MLSNEMSGAAKIQLLNSSVFEYFGLNNVEYTEISQLNTDMTALAAPYFSIKGSPENTAKNGDILAVVVNTPFRADNSGHKGFLVRCASLKSEKEAVLKAIDTNIKACVVLFLVAANLTFLPFAGLAFYAAFGGALYFMSQRGFVEHEFNQSCALLAGALNWSVGPKRSERKSSDDALKNCEEIGIMMRAVYPLVNETQLKHFVADDIEQHFCQGLRNFEKQYKVSNTAATLFGSKELALDVTLSTKELAANRCIYGLNRNRPIDYLDAALSILPGLLWAAWDKVQDKAGSFSASNAM